MSETERLLAIRAALLQTTNTVGWNYVKQMADNIVKMTTQQALDEEDPNKGELKRIKAKAMQQGFNSFFSTIETAKSFGTDSEPDWFGQLSEYEVMEHGGTSRTES